MYQRLTRPLKFIIYVLFVCTTFAELSAQTNRHIHGVVLDTQGQPIPSATVTIEGSRQKLYTDERGLFTSGPLPAGRYKVSVSAMGFEDYNQTIPIPAKHGRLTMTLSDKLSDIEHVHVTGKSAIQEVRESPFNVTALDAKRFHNSSLELSDLLNRASGVKVRQSGGLGSNTAINLNGFTGRHIKIFMDGIPMEGMGTAFQLNNIPINLAERIEIYKGVVPIELGADALGGAINIITNTRNKTFLDASYSYGSFNTHRTNVNFGYTNKHGFTMQLNAFQNYSDNNYRVYTRVMDIQNNNFSADSVWVRRFNDTYHNETIIGKIGFMNVSWADQFLLSATVGQEYAEIQNAYLMQIAYGERHRRGNTVMPALTYAKRDFLLDDLDIRLTANYNKNYNQNVDTSRYQYNWYGERQLLNGGRIGEGNATLAEFYNRNANSSLNLAYDLSDRHSVALNNVVSTYSRSNADPNRVIDETTNEDTRSSNLKNTLGVSYKYNWNNKLVATAFGKHYLQRVTGSMNVSEVPGSTVYERRTSQANNTGYGVAATYFLNHWQVKASAERALRMPTDVELFGDEVLETGNAGLRPEKSMNLNLGFIYQQDFNEDHAVYLDVSGMYRKVDDFIRREINARYGTIMNMNHGLVQNFGLNFEGRYYYRQILHIGGAFTVQDIRDREPFVSASSTQPNPHRGDRVPNQPYLFGNGEIEYFIHNPFKKRDVLTLGYILNYVHPFYLRWESLGASGEKDVVAKQLSHDFTATYSMQGGKYNIAFEARNITDQRLYDNFSMQKPGRQFHVKVRYFFAQNN
ncbi:TonB-dependent receptor [Sphingobacterium sp. lm-10]|uniref:TonB-dependent receptor domain-containing protein n=1 Tax=Sphingobacterium sp. lm-10 TaxID=2944904 RepID=UPI00202212F4|nr:TonB-dependent receptor [Sphingobacterium sp. lm-10]MCL7988194.1 TonB-dependent receptor [Sphingobacterium sp. lm-10]